MNILADIIKLISKLPPEGLALLSQLVRALYTSRDPEAALKRSIAATAAKKAIRLPFKR